VPPSGGTFFWVTLEITLDRLPSESNHILLSISIGDHKLLHQYIEEPAMMPTRNTLFRPIILGVKPSHMGLAGKEAIPMKRFICGLMLLASIACLVPRPALAQATNPYIGEIQIFAFNFCPVGWATLQGQLLAINQNAALFSLLGTTYGGDGITTFALPKWGSMLTANGGALTPCISLFGVFPSRN
jgi:hypothetical protein